MTATYKKEDWRKCENCHDIIVKATFIRLYRLILKDFIEEGNEMKESEEQSGFRAIRSCIDNIFSLKQFVEKEMAGRHRIPLLLIVYTKQLTLTVKH